MRKIGVVYAVLVILLVIALGIRFWQGNNLRKAIQSSLAPKPVSYVGKISLEAQQTSYKVQDGIDLEIFIEAQGKALDGTDVILQFDPAILNAVGITSGTYFNLTPRKDIDNTEGLVKIISLDPASEGPLTQKISLGTVHFTAIGEGTTQVNFDFKAGETTKTTIIEQGTSGNILGEAKGITIDIKD